MSVEQHISHPSRMQHYDDNDNSSEEEEAIDSDDEDAEEDDDSGKLESKFHIFTACCSEQTGGRRPKWFLGQVLDPRAKWVQEWNRIFLLVCAAGLVIDPLFFYTLSISGEVFVKKNGTFLWVVIPALLEKGSVTLVMTVFLMFFIQYVSKIYHSICLLRRMQNLSGYIFGTVWWGIALNLIAYFVAAHGWQRKLDPGYDMMHTLQSLLFKADWAESFSYTMEGVNAP